MYETCFYCLERAIEHGGITTDHIVPLSKGGLCKRSNYVRCCKECNHFKDNKRLQDWYSEIDYLINEKISLPKYSIPRLGNIRKSIKKLLTDKNRKHILRA